MKVFKIEEIYKFILYKTFYSRPSGRLFLYPYIENHKYFRRIL